MTNNFANLALFSFAITTIILSVNNCRNTGDDLWISFAVFIGGGIQLFVGILDILYCKLFTGIVFTNYGCFWLMLYFNHIWYPEVITNYLLTYFFITLLIIILFLMPNYQNDHIYNLINIKTI